MGGAHPCSPGEGLEAKPQQNGKNNLTNNQASQALPHERLENNQFLPNSHWKNGKHRIRISHQVRSTPGAELQREKQKHPSVFLVFLTWLRDRGRARGFHGTTRNSWSRGRLGNSQRSSQSRRSPAWARQSKASVCHRDRKPERERPGGEGTNPERDRDRARRELLQNAGSLPAPWAFPAPLCCPGRLLIPG